LPTTVASPTAAAPTPSASPVTPAVVELIPPNTETPGLDGAVGLDWSRVDADDGHGSAIAYGPAGWLYVATFDGGFPASPRLRLSSDLRTWHERKPDIPEIQGGMDWTFAASKDAYVLAGGGIFRSADGRHWESVVAASAGAGPVDVDHVVSDGSGFVAWRGTSAAPGLWTSSDGRTWTAVALPGAPAVIVDAVAARPSGGYVAAGRSGESAAELDRIEGPAQRWEARPGTEAVWLSDDGIIWSSVPLGAGFEEARITGLAAGGPGGGIVAVGNDKPFAEDRNIERVVAVWRWVDDTGWQRLMGQGFPVLEANAGDTRVLATADRWLLIGQRMRADALNVLDLTPSGVLAGSEDGTAWWATSPIVLGSGASAYSIDAIAAAPDRLAILTNGGPSLVGVVRVWMSP
jgi:hypothetical protein